MRVVISSLQQHLNDNTVKDIIHVKSKDQLGDIFTKKGVSAERILNVVKKGTILHDPD